MADQRLKGQEISIRVIQSGNVLTQIDSVSEFTDTVALEIKEMGYLGETVNRFDEILNGHGGNFAFHVTTSRWNDFIDAVKDRAERRNPGITFNVVRTDFFPSGDTAIYTYQDVFWGAFPTSVPSRGDYAKVSAEFKCSNRPVKQNSLP